MPVEGHWDRHKKRWRDGLTERTGASVWRISHALTSLAAAGYEMREQIGTDKRGRPVFAVKGRALRFQVPPLPPRPEPVGSENPPPTDKAKVVHFSPVGGAELSFRWSDSTTPSPHGPLTIPSSVVASPLTVAEVEGGPPASGQDRQREEDQDRHLNGHEARRRLALRQLAEARADRLAFSSTTAPTGTDGQ
jgi:hypothetical protein